MSSTDDRPPPRGGIAEGLRTGLGVLAAFRDAVEETIDEAVARGDLSPERAKSVVREAAGRVQVSLEEVRERLDVVVPRREFDLLRMELDELRARVEAMERQGADPPSLRGGDGDANEAGTADGGVVDEIPID